MASKFKIRRGEWAGLSAITVGCLMGCSHQHARELMRSLENIVGNNFTLEQIGELIQEYRNKKDVQRINKWGASGR